MPARSRLLRRVTLGALVLAVGIQLVPVDRTNPPVELDAPVPRAVKAVLRQSCYDCHSNETRWPWYSWVAPVSWIVGYDVEEAREHLNFSTWNRYDAEERIELIEEAWEEVEDGEMPLWYYVPLHPEAALDDEDRAVLKTWAEEAEE